jgi:hypothetical protein
MSVWSETELRAAVAAYLSMLASQTIKAPYSKAEIRRQLRKGVLSTRSEASIEFRMRNISAVLDSQGREIVRGYVPAKNVGAETASQISKLLAEEATVLPHSPEPSPSALSARPPKMIYFNIGWMKRYDGPADDDPTIGAHGYLHAFKHGAEAYNFTPGRDGILRGYRPPGSAEQTHIERLGAKGTDPFLDNVTVIWMAKEPATGVTYIVGWYLNARVYRDAQDAGMILNGEPHFYSVETSIDRGRLLPPVSRTFHVQSSRTAPGEGFGQKPTWYGSQAVNERVWRYIRSIEGGAAKQGSSPKTPPKNLDPELRRRVERAAVDHAINYYRALFGASCRIESVETQAKGWDLEVYAGVEPLLIEVKGLLNAALMCELSPNEYEKMMMRAHKRRYVVYVVTNALAEAPGVPISSVFEHVGDRDWQTADGRTLIINEKVGAILTSQ